MPSEGRGQAWMQGGIPISAMPVLIPRGQWEAHYSPLRNDTQCATEHLSYSRLDFFPASDFRFDPAVAKICSNEYWV
ncbi:hypothetical protein F9C07_51 [Aspergillus flavus]|uniref:Uncharacterized protein n=1 Tax=Aspergillus flavus (strain ATCC 200026 / FGSC A1120 / IAM 13836 / NRRL 3357 / JCM 12722 / SRRC 167) TaxID=332952 RepID=A0A7U2QW63_ASPFN|nr:hypothetical protein F9C07_51 [Aspergillus flavus]